MAEFVSIMAMAHAPGVTGWLEACPAADQEAIRAGYEALGLHHEGGEVPT